VEVVGEDDSGIGGGEKLLNFFPSQTNASISVK
jgi:hypothetical protein